MSVRIQNRKKADDIYILLYTENIMANIGLEKQCKLLRQLETKIEKNVSVDCYSLMDNKAKLYRTDSSHGDPDVSLLLLENGCTCEIMSEESLIQGAVDKLKSTIKYSDQCSVKSLEGIYHRPFIFENLH